MLTSDYELLIEFIEEILKPEFRINYQKSIVPSCSHHLEIYSSNSVSKWCANIYIYPMEIVGTQIRVSYGYLYSVNYWLNVSDPEFSNKLKATIQKGLESYPLTRS